jgi:transposase
MARPRRIDHQLVQKALGVSRRTQDSRELREALAVLLPAQMNATMEQTAQLLGIGRATVARLQRAFGGRRPATAPRKIWGGRRRALMSLAQEREFLEPWEKQAKEGGVLVLSPMRAALAQKLGRKVNRSVVWRLLARHGWRKVAPDTRHPKSDPQVQEAWKKNSRRIWRPC